MKILLIVVVINMNSVTKITTEQAMPSLEACKVQAHIIMSTEIPKHLVVTKVLCKEFGKT